MTKTTKIINVISLIFISSFISYKIVYWIGEKYFFDQLFYYKSVSHGYWTSDKNLKLEDFGRRS